MRHREAEAFHPVVDAAVSSARAAFNDGRWSTLHPAERKQVFLRLAGLIENQALELSVMESLDAGKTIFDWQAEAIDEIYVQISPALTITYR